jgi:hypothetical protein
MSDKPVADQAKDTAQSAKEQVAGMYFGQFRGSTRILITVLGKPSVFDKDGAVGKQFQPDGAVGSS